MKGKYFINIGNKRVSYSLEFKRNVTLIKGNSGTGKSTLINMIEDYKKFGKSSGIHVSTNIKNMVVLDYDTDWVSLLTSVRDTILFADEFVSYCYSREFARLFLESGNYIVLVSRDGRLGALPCAVDEIYYLKSENNGNYYSTRLYNCYEDDVLSFRPDIVVTEDSKSGYAIINNILNCEVVSAYGKDKVYTKVTELLSTGYSRIYVIVDGAVFGNQIQKLISLCSNYDLYIFAPESFEFLLLNTSFFSKFLSTELSETYLYVDSLEFITWERYYTHLLRSLCVNYTGVSYSKSDWSELNPFFKRVAILKQIAYQLKDLDNSIKLV